MFDNKMYNCCYFDHLHVVRHSSISQGAVGGAGHLAGAGLWLPGDLRPSGLNFLLNTKSHGILSSDTKFMGEHIQAGQFY